MEPRKVKIAPHEVALYSGSVLFGPTKSGAPLLLKAVRTLLSEGLRRKETGRRKPQLAESTVSYYLKQSSKLIGVYRESKYKSPEIKKQKLLYIYKGFYN